MPLPSGGQMSFGDVYNEITGENLPNPLISITNAELGLLKNSSGQTIPLNQDSQYKPDGTLPTVFPTEWYRYCQTCFLPKPFLQITKSQTGQAYTGVRFTYVITITNFGEATTSGTITVIDNLPANLIFQDASGTNWSATTSGQRVTASYTGTLAVGQSTTLAIGVLTYVTGTYYNYATVSGGNDPNTRNSNTTSTSVIVQTWTSTVTLRQDRTVQRNNCGQYGTGSYVQVYSPYFTRTYTSYISQEDADTMAYAYAINDAVNWLNANAQNVANSEGSCSYNYPVLQLSKSMLNTNINRFDETIVIITVRNYVANTSGRLTVTDVLDPKLPYINIASLPSGWNFTVSGRTVQFYTDNSLPVGYDDNLQFIVRGNEVGSFTNKATASGGNIQGNYAESNTVSGTIYANPSYSYYTSARNFSNNTGEWDSRSFNTNHNVTTPTDVIGGLTKLTISTADSGNDVIRIRFLSLSGFNIQGYKFQANWPTDYFRLEENGSYIDFVSNVSDIPVGDYYFQYVWQFPYDWIEPTGYGSWYRKDNGQQLPLTPTTGNPDPDQKWIYVDNNICQLFVNNNNLTDTAWVTTPNSNKGYFRFYFLTNYKFYIYIESFQNRTPTYASGLTFTYNFDPYTTFTNNLNTTNQGRAFFTFIWLKNPNRYYTQEIFANNYSPGYWVEYFFKPREFYFGLLIANYSVRFYGTPIATSFIGNVDYYQCGDKTYQENINSQFPEPYNRSAGFKVMVNDDGSYAYCTGSTEPYWQDYGEIYYIAGQPYINQRDINFNSPTYGDTRSVPLY